MTLVWPELSYSAWRETCDTVHGHTQVLGKLAVALAPSEPQLQHAALRLTARGWETAPLPAPDGSGALVVALDLRNHEAVVEGSGGSEQRITLTGERSVGAICRELLAAVRRVAGTVEINPAPQEVSWSVALDEDEEHATYDPVQVEAYFAAATQAALALAAFRAPYRGRSTPVNAWWGSFDLAVNLFSGRAGRASGAGLHHAQRDGRPGGRRGWWPGDARYDRAAFYAYAHPAPDGFAGGDLEPTAARWEPALGEYVLDWEDVRKADDPHAAAVQFARSAFATAAQSASGIPASVPVPTASPRRCTERKSSDPRRGMTPLSAGRGGSAIESFGWPAIAEETMSVYRQALAAAVSRSAGVRSGERPRPLGGRGDRRQLWPGDPRRRRDRRQLRSPSEHERPHAAGSMNAVATRLASDSVASEAVQRKAA